MAEKRKNYEVCSEETKNWNKTEWHNPQDAQTDDRLKEAIAKRHLPVWNPFFVGQQLIDMPAVSLKQVRALSDPNKRRIQLICGDQSEEDVGRRFTENCFEQKWVTRPSQSLSVKTLDAF